MHSSIFCASKLLRLGDSVSTIPASGAELEIRAQIASFQAQLDSLKNLSEQKEKPPERPFRKMPANIMEAPVFPDNQLGVGSQLTNADVFGPSDPDPLMDLEAKTSEALVTSPTPEQPAEATDQSAATASQQPMEPEAVNDVPKMDVPQNAVVPDAVEQEVATQAVEQEVPAVKQMEQMPKSVEEPVPQEPKMPENANLVVQQEPNVEQVPETMAKSVEEPETMAKSVEEVPETVANSVKEVPETVANSAVEKCGEVVSEAPEQTFPPDGLNSQAADLVKSSGQQAGQEAMISQLQQKLLEMQSKLDASTAAEKARQAKEVDAVTPAPKQTGAVVAPKAAAVKPPSETEVDLAQLGNEDAPVELDPAMRELIVNGSKTRSKGDSMDPPPGDEGDDAIVEESDDKINTNTHRNSAMRLRRAMEGTDAQKFPYMKKLFDGSAAVAWP